MVRDDPFSILGISPSASQDEIRSAYKRLAKQHHPDVQPNDPGAAERFRRIRDAYLAARALREGRVDSKAKKEAPKGHPPPRPGSNTNDLKEMFEEVLKSKRREYEARRPTRRPTAERDARGKVEGVIRVPFEVAVKGGEHVLEVESQGSEYRRKVSLPPGIVDGDLLKVEGQVLKASVEPHAFLRREGNDVILDLPLTVAELALGADVLVPTVDGTVELSVPTGTRPGQKLRIRGKGVPGKGDQLNIVEISMPDATQSRTREALEALDSADDRSPRGWDPPGTPTGTKVYW